MKFNLSYSSLSLYKESPITFYLQYIKKAPSSDKTVEVYGMAGNVVHDFLEMFVSGQQADFNQMWKDKGLSLEQGFNGQPLSIFIYQNCVAAGQRKINMLKQLNFELKAEERIQFDWDDEVLIKGFIDVVATKGKTIYLLDYKTDSSTEKDKHRSQQLFYSWLYWRKYKVIPDNCIWLYLKLGREDNNSFTEKDILEFDSYITKVIEEIQNKGDDINNYEVGDYDTVFNKYKTFISNHINKPKTIILKLKKAKIYFITPIDTIEQNIINEFSYELKNAFFIKRAMGKRRVKFDGYKRFYTVKDQSLPIGFYNHLIDYLTANGFKLKIIDEREPLKEYPMIEKLNGKELRPYQQDAVDYAMKKKITFLELVTSSGKTLIAAEIIRRNKGLTLFVVDRGLLLTQTKKEFETLLGTEIGTMTKGKIDLKVVNIATIQTLNSLIKKKDKTLMKILSNIKTFIIDEGHTVAAKTFIELGKYVLNADMRIGLSGTYDRPDGDTMMIESVVGNNIFRIGAQELIEKGFIMLPNIWFFKYDKKSHLGCETYNDYYKSVIVNNPNRNQLLLDLVERFKGKNILIIISEIAHGDILKQALPEAVFIQGSVDEEIRDKWLDDMRKDKQKIIIGTASIVQKGLNIVNLDMMINATGNDSSIISLQSLGRILRKAKDKNDCYYIDFYDQDSEYFFNHTCERMNTFKSKGYKIKILKAK